MINLREMKADELRDIARAYGIVGAWKKTKDQLIESVINAVKLNGDANKYYDTSLEPQNETESTETTKSSKLSDSTKNAPERNSNNDYTITANNSDGSTTIIAEVHHEDITQNEPEQLQNAPYGHDDSESDNLSAEEEKTPERNSELKKYAAWVKDRETKELAKVFGEANSREEFYNLIKGKYRVRLITKPEKIDDECEQWKIRHARNLTIKKEKYAADKEKAKVLGMNVMQYRKEVKKS